MRWWGLPTPQQQHWQVQHDLNYPVLVSIRVPAEALFELFHASRKVDWFLISVHVRGRDTD